MTKRRLLALLCIIVVLTGAIAALVSCAPSQLYVDNSKLHVEMNDDYYLGINSIDGEGYNNKFDLTKAFEGASFAAEDNEVAILDGNIVTLKGEGEFKLDVTKDGKKSTKNVFVKNAVNVFNFNELEKTVETNKKSAVIHKEITFPKTVKEGKRTTSHNIAVSDNTAIYGNGNVINAEGAAKPIDRNWGSDALSVVGRNVTLQDFQIMGMDLRGMSDDELKTFDIGKLETFGSLITFNSDDFKNKPVGGLMKNIVAENGHGVISVTGADLTIEGCMFKNASDSLIKVETKDNGGTKLTLKNNVMINAVVAAIVCWGYNNTESYLDMKIEGFLDVYNWKSSKTTKIMPSSENFSNVANSAVAGELAKKQYDKFFHKMGGDKYLHSAMMIISTGGLKVNNARVNGVQVAKEVSEDKSISLQNTDMFVIRQLPVSGFKLFINTACIIGYGNNDESKGIVVSPSTKLNTKTIHAELRNGRK